jgi:hypothetical protein
MNVNDSVQLPHHVGRSYEAAVVTMMPTVRVNSTVLIFLTKEYQQPPI